MLSAGLKAGTKSYQSSSELSSEGDDDNRISSVRSYDSFSNTRKQEMSSPHLASPSKRSASQLNSLTVSQRQAAKEGNQRRMERQYSSGSSSSSSEGEDDHDDSFDASPKKKIKPASKVNAAEKNMGKYLSKKPSGVYHFEKSEPHQDYSEAIRQSQEENKARLAEMDMMLSKAVNGKSSSSGSSEVPLLVKDLRTCPICSDSMPRKKSAELEVLMQPLLDRYHQKKKIGVTDSLEACQRHRDEAKTIPDGRSKGWRKALDENKLKAQVRNEKNPFINIMKQRIEDPTSSEWFNHIVRARKMYGRQAESTTAQMQNMREMQAGYFGEQGWEILGNTLTDMFIDYPQPEYDLKELSAIPDGPLQRLSPQAFVERVLLPELILMLIIFDRRGRNESITMEQAKIIRDESANYGIALFPSNAMGIAADGRNAFGDGNDKSSPASRKSTGKTNSQIEIKIGNKQAKPVHSPAKGSNTPVQKVADHKASRSTSKTPVSLSLPSQQVSSRPRPRPAARKTNSEMIASATLDLTQSSNQSLSSQEMNGRDVDSAIIISPNKPIITEPISIPSSFESTSQASQELSSQLTRFDSPGDKSQLSDQEIPRLWKQTGSLGYN